MLWETVIGLETHVQLATQSKIFSTASTRFGAPPNTQANEVDLALPGTLPVLNREAVLLAVRLGCAIQAKVASRSVFARKNYFYPDLPKGYQISQHDQPLIIGGGLYIQMEKAEKQWIRITRAHLEEDAGKSLHTGRDLSGIDLNRAGVPLLEIVSEPDLRSAKEAATYARTLHALVVWLGICDGNLQEGSFRCDANVSIRQKGSSGLGIRTEIKNLNSFRFLEMAIDFEMRRQIESYEEGVPIRQETRLYDPEINETRPMRSKEDAHDYRYFPDPDLPVLLVDEALVSQVMADLPELPQARRERWLVGGYLSESHASWLSSDRALADFFEETFAALTGDSSVITLNRPVIFAEELRSSEGLKGADPSVGKTIANWMMSDLSAALNREGLSIDKSRVKPFVLASIIRRVLDKTISTSSAKNLFGELWLNPLLDGANVAQVVDQLIEVKGFRQNQEVEYLQKLIDEVISSDPTSVTAFSKGNEKALNSLVGKVMKASKGRANPQQVVDVLRKKIKPSPS